MTGNDPEFNLVIGTLDFILSKLMGYGKDATKGLLSEPNRQTLKHHAEDMEAAAKAIYKRLGINQEGTPQPLLTKQEHKGVVTKTEQKVENPTDTETKQQHDKEWKAAGDSAVKSATRQPDGTFAIQSEKRPDHVAPVPPKYTAGPESVRKTIPPHILRDITESKRKFFQRMGLTFPGDEQLDPITVEFPTNVPVIPHYSILPRDLPHGLGTSTVLSGPGSSVTAPDNQTLARQSGVGEDRGNQETVRVGELANRPSEGSGPTGEGDTQQPSAAGVDNPGGSSDWRCKWHKDAFNRCVLPNGHSGPHNPGSLQGRVDPAKPGSERTVRVSWCRDCGQPRTQCRCAPGSD
jgi:hypothetical protein